MANSHLIDFNEKLKYTYFMKIDFHSQTTVIETQKLYFL